MVETSSGNEAWVQRGQKVLLGNYRPMPITLISGEGARVTDADGNTYIDFVSGIAVTSLGHSHPKLVAALQEQASKILHTANVVWNEQAIMLAEKLVENSFAERVYFCNSGAEAIEAMLKLARKVFFDRGEGRFEIISFDKSFHGRTMGSLTVTGQEKYHLGFEPLLPGVKTIPYGDIQALEQAMTERTAAVLLEPIQGEAGVRIPPAGFVRAVREVTQRHGCLMLLDEVQTGVGRTGTVWSYEQEGVVPDAMSVAKGIGGGVPLGAMLTTTALGAALPFGSHGSTFGGNPLACAAGNVVMDMVSNPAFLSHVRVMGEHLLGRLHALARTHRKIVVEARGRGLLCALELNVDLAKLPRAALSRGLLLNTVAGKIIRFAPPLTIDQATIDQGLDILDSLLAEMTTERTRV